MKTIVISFFTFLFCTCLLAQSDVQQMVDTEKAFGNAAAEKGMKAAFLEFLSDNSIVFQPNAVNGKDFWKSRDDASPARLFRNLTYADIASNGLLGYTTGSWRLYPKGKADSQTEFGEYVTIWQKNQNGEFRAIVDISISHDKLDSTEPDRQLMANSSRDPNKRGWSAADPSMNFLRMSMSKQGLGGAYKKFAAEDVRLLREKFPPIIGKNNVVLETRQYISIGFPPKMALTESADMAYVWNACEFTDSSEGTEKGNSLHVWKLRNEKWWIVLGVIAAVPNQTPPTLRSKEKNKHSQ